MNRTSILFACLFASGVALAQAPAEVLTRPAQETNPAASGGMPAAKAQTKADMKQGMDGSAAMAPAKGGMGMGMGKGMGASAMDTNGDGMVSKKEWTDHHTKMWAMMKSKNGKVPVADVDATLQGGPN